MKEQMLITDDVHESMINDFIEMGHDVDYRPDITLDEVRKVVKNYTVLVINSKILADKQLIDRGTRLKVIGRLGSGLEIIDIPYAKSKGIHVLSVPEGNSNAVGEYTLGMLLCLLNNMHIADRDVRSGLWNREPNRGVELDGKTIGIYGMGHTGTAFAKKLRGFDVTVLGYDKYKKGFGNEFVTESSPEEIFDKAEIISLHLPLTGETKKLVSSSFIAGFRKEIYLINTARGRIVNTMDLLEALKKGKVLGAALDVLENEKISSLGRDDKIWFDQLIAENKILVTPHIAGWTRESKLKIAEHLKEKIRKVLV